MVKIKNLLFNIEIEVNEEKKTKKLNENSKKTKIKSERKSIKNMEKIGTFEDMVVVNGDKYKPSFRQDEVKVIDLEVSKYQVTNNLWNNIMKNTGGDMLPVVNITYWEALEFCNKLSKKYGLKPVYKINNQSIKIIELDGKEVAPRNADFLKTEGFRLPTEVEWEWFARGGEVALQNNTFDYEYSGSNNIDEVAVYNTNKVKRVGTKKSNQLGLYDCSGNVWEWCCDTMKLWEESISTKKYFIYDESENFRVLRGCSWRFDAASCTVSSRDCTWFDFANGNIGFRVVRTL